MRKFNEEGYTLIEVLIGLFIFSIGALASGMMIIASLHQNQTARGRTVAATLVSQRLEELRSRPWSGGAIGESLLAGGNILDDDQLRSYSSGSLATGYGETFNIELTGSADSSSMEPFYIVMWRIQNMTDSGLDFKRITIRGVSMTRHRDSDRWEPAVAFDHVAMVFRELKDQ